MKTIITIILGILLIGIAVGTGVSLSNIEVSKEDITKLQSVDSIEFIYTPINCDLETCDEVNIKSGYSNMMWKPQPYYETCLEYENEIMEEEGDINEIIVCKEYGRIYYTNQELESQLTKQIEDIKERIIERVKINEDSEIKTEKVAGGTATIIQTKWKSHQN